MRCSPHECRRTCPWMARWRSAPVCTFERPDHICRVVRRTTGLVERWKKNGPVICAVPASSIARSVQRKRRSLTGSGVFFRT